MIEPFLTDQWYVDAKTLAQPAIAAVREGRTVFVPSNWEATYFNWMENIQPWCISRQLWWGHQIPAWYGFAADAQGNALVGSSQQLSSVGRDLRSACPRRKRSRKARTYYGVEDVAGRRNERAAVEQVSAAQRGGNTKRFAIWRDEDVLDTWFSSALWPFSTLGWPEPTGELARYYPTDVLVTGFDIIFFWVARMMMMGLKFMDEVPFRTVYIHALVRDQHGAKMAKSKGNVIDPLELIDEYGADALRLTLAAMAAQGRDIKLSTQRVEGYRNFATKLWNACRFAEINHCVTVPRSSTRAPQRRRSTAGSRTRPAKAVREVTAAIESYRFNEAADRAYRFVWNIFCDWYLELAKPVLQGADGPAKNETRAMIAWMRDEILKLLHPFTPFVTEELWRVTAEGGPAREPAAGACALARARTASTTLRRRPRSAG